MKNYRKFMEPKYGEVAPEVCIMPPEILDMEHTKEWRMRHDFESVASMTAAYQKCVCYEDIMGIQTEDVLCKLAGETVRVRIYKPKGAGKRPVLLYYHGGAFSMNSIEVYEYVQRYLCCYGNMIVVAPDYHLAPEYKFPQGLYEAYETLLWAYEHIEKYEGDKEAMYVGGDSSGGNFAAVVSMMARDKKGPSIQGQILYYPLTTHVEDALTDSEKRYEKGYFLEYNCMKDPMNFYFTQAEDKTNPYASPLLAENLKDLPSACFISAECDPLLDQGLMYAARLKDSMVKVEYHIVEGMVHGFLNWTYGKTFDALNMAIAFINQK